MARKISRLAIVDSNLSDESSSRSLPPVIKFRYSSSSIKKKNKPIKKKLRKISNKVSHTSSVSIQKQCSSVQSEPMISMVSSIT